MQQSSDAFEVVIVDDGSVKSCADLCDRFAAEDERIRVIHQEGNGVSAARNRGIEAADAEWIMMVDADDWLEPDAVETLRDEVCCNSCDILMFKAVKEYSGKKEILEYKLEGNKIYNMEDIGVKKSFYRRAMGTPNSRSGRSGVICYCWDKVYRKEFLISNGIKFPEGVSKSEDKVFVLSCFEKMRSLFFIDRTLYHYRINSASVCNSYSETADEDRIRLAEMLEETARRMDKEIGGLLGDPDYDGITQEFQRFIFGIISDVLLLKYYHPDYRAGSLSRHREAKAFLKTEPFRSSIRSCSYKELTADAGLKKFLLSHNMSGTFCRLKNARKRRKGAIAEQ